MSSGGEDCSGWGENPRVREVGRDDEDSDQQFGGNCWIGTE